MPAELRAWDTSPYSHPWEWMFPKPDAVCLKVFPHPHSCPCPPYLCSMMHLALPPRYNFRKLTLRVLHLPLRINRKQERTRRETHLEFNWNAHFPITPLWTSELQRFFYHHCCNSALEQPPRAIQGQGSTGAGSRVRFGSILLLRSS